MVPKVLLVTTHSVERGLRRNVRVIYFDTGTGTTLSLRGSLRTGYVPSVHILTFVTRKPRIDTMMDRRWDCTMDSKDLETTYYSGWNVPTTYTRG